jgi:RNA-directed DNA polymerase
MATKEDTIKSLRLRKNEFCSIGNLMDLSSKLGFPIQQINDFAQNPYYHEFDIPKKNGKIRHIEDPNDELKELLRNLNYFLQSTYYFIRSDAAFGFMSVPLDDPSPRNIRTNAEVHCDCNYMLNADFLDFFHQIKTIEIYEIFLSPPFNFNHEIAEILSKLCTYKGRLPMGSPTSPVLSNFACRLLDMDYLNMAQKYNWRYTRFADDLTFSSENAITIVHLGEIRYIAKGYGLQFNENKIHFFEPHQTKIVTGLVVSNRVDITDEYLKDLRKEIDKYRIALEINYRTGRQPTAWLEKFRQQIEGAIEFVRQIETSKSPDYQAIKQYYNEASDIETGFKQISWLDFGYNQFI